MADYTARPRCPSSLSDGRREGIPREGREGRESMESRLASSLGFLRPTSAKGLHKQPPAQPSSRAAHVFKVTVPRSRDRSHGGGGQDESALSEKLKGWCRDLPHTPPFVTDIRDSIPFTSLSSSLPSSQLIFSRNPGNFSNYLSTQNHINRVHSLNHRHRLHATNHNTNHNKQDNQKRQQQQQQRHARGSQSVDLNNSNGYMGEISAAGNVFSRLYQGAASHKKQREERAELPHPEPPALAAAALSYAGVRRDDAGRIVEEEVPRVFQRLYSSSNQSKKTSDGGEGHVATPSTLVVDAMKRGAGFRPLPPPPAQCASSRTDALLARLQAKTARNNQQVQKERKAEQAVNDQREREEYVAHLPYPPTELDLAAAMHKQLLQTQRRVDQEMGALQQYETVLVREELLEENREVAGKLVAMVQKREQREQRHAKLGVVHQEKGRQCNVLRSELDLVLAASGERERLLVQLKNELKEMKKLIPLEASGPLPLRGLPRDEHVTDHLTSGRFAGQRNNEEEENPTSCFSSSSAAAMAACGVEKTVDMWGDEDDRVDFAWRDAAEEEAVAREEKAAAMAAAAEAKRELESAAWREQTEQEEQEYTRLDELRGGSVPPPQTALGIEIVGRTTQGEDICTLFVKRTLLAAKLRESQRGSLEQAADAQQLGDMVAVLERERMERNDKLSTLQQAVAAHQANLVEARQVAQAVQQYKKQARRMRHKLRQSRQRQLKAVGGTAHRTFIAEAKEEAKEGEGEVDQEASNPSPHSQEQQRLIAGFAQLEEHLGIGPGLEDGPQEICDKYITLMEERSELTADVARMKGRLQDLTAQLRLQGRLEGSTTTQPAEEAAEVVTRGTGEEDEQVEGGREQDGSAGRLQLQARVAAAAERRLQLEQQAHQADRLVTQLSKNVHTLARLLARVPTHDNNNHHHKCGDVILAKPTNFGEGGDIGSLLQQCGQKLAVLHRRSLLAPS